VSEKLIFDFNFQSRNCPRLQLDRYARLMWISNPDAAPVKVVVPTCWFIEEIWKNILLSLSSLFVA
jgi:hypothetical protein